jgi:hypothetical protein
MVTDDLERTLCVLHLLVEHRHELLDSHINRLDAFLQFGLWAVTFTYSDMDVIVVGSVNLERHMDTTKIRAFIVNSRGVEDGPLFGHHDSYITRSCVRMKVCQSTQVIRS